VNIFYWILIPQFKILLRETQEREHDMRKKILDVILQQVPRHFRLDAATSDCVSYR